MFQSQVDFHGYKADDTVEIKRWRDGEHNIRLEDVLAKLMKLVMNGFGFNWRSELLYGSGFWHENDNCWDMKLVQ
jgi:hypothetical protein